MKSSWSEKHQEQQGRNCREIKGQEYDEKLSRDHNENGRKLQNTFTNQFSPMKDNEPRISICMPYNSD